MLNYFKWSTEFKKQPKKPLTFIAVIEDAAAQ